MKKLLLAATAMLCATTAAHASIIPSLASIVDEGGGLFRYNYTASLAGDQGLVDGSKLVIFDFAGFSGGLTTPAGFLASTELSSGLFAPGQTDDPTLENLVFTWNGGPFHTTGGPFSEINFDGFSALSTLNGKALDGFAALAVKNNEGSATGTPTFNSGSVEVPAGGVPEPAAWGLMILGFGGVGALVRRRRGDRAFA